MEEDVEEDEPVGETERTNSESEAECESEESEAEAEEEEHRATVQNKFALLTEDD